MSTSDNLRSKWTV